MARTAISQKIADDIIGHQVDLLRVEASERTRVLRLINKLQSELTGMIGQDDLTSYNKARLTALLRQANESIDSYYARIQGTLTTTLDSVAQAQAAHVAALITVSTGANLPTETFMSRLVSNVLIQGAPSSMWWERQSRNLAFKFANIVRQGAAIGQTNEQIVARVTGSASAGVPGVMNTTRAAARSLVHTSLQTVANASRMETFRSNGDIVKGVRQLSTLDGHTTDICLAYDGSEWDLDGNPLSGTTLPFVNEEGTEDGVPRHWGCRSVMVPITVSFKDLGLNVKELPPVDRPRSNGARSMDEWLDNRTPEQLDEQLGPGRADLYRRGVITREQLLNFAGNPLTLAQLVKKYGP